MSMQYRRPRKTTARRPGQRTRTTARRPGQKQPKSTVGKRMGFATPSVSALANVKANPAYRNPAGGTLGTATHPTNDPTGARARLISPSGTGKRQGPGKVPGVTTGDVLRAAAKARTKAGAPKGAPLRPLRAPGVKNLALQKRLKLARAMRKRIDLRRRSRPGIPR